MINYFKEVVEDIQYQFSQLSDKVLVCEEQTFFNSIPQPDKFYAVVKFNSASSNFAQVSLPITIYLWGTSNNVEEAKTLLLQYVLTYNIYTDSEGKKTQFYSTPTIIQNFTEQGSTFRSLYYCSGQFIFGKNADRISKIVYNGKEIPFLSAKWTLSNTPNTQPFPNTNGLTQTVNQFGTISFGISTYLTTDNELVEHIQNYINNRTYFINISYNITIYYISGKSRTYDFKLVSFDINQSLGSLPSVSLAFTL